MSAFPTVDCFQSLSAERQTELNAFSPSFIPTRLGRVDGGGVRALVTLDIRAFLLFRSSSNDSE